MKVELPEFKRCCFCIPLRYGLLAWGYIKLVITFLLLLLVTYYEMVFIMIATRTPYDMIIAELVISFVLLAFLLVDFSMTIVFLIGGHKKTVRLLNIFNFYSIVMLCLYIVFFVACTTLEMYLRGRYSGHTPRMAAGVMEYIRIFFGLASIGVQVYIILLIRSETNKLKNNCKFRLSNMGNEAECTMENGMNEQENGIDSLKDKTDRLKNGTDHEIEIDAQIEETFDQNKKINSGAFNYNKL